MIGTDAIRAMAGKGMHECSDPELDPRTDDELEDEIAEMCSHIDAATYRLLLAIAEFDRRELWGWGFQSTAHWLTWRVGIDIGTAREKVRVARALEGLPKISDTFRQGKVSYSKVRAMTRIASPQNEEYLLYIAENGTASDVESLVRAYRRASKGEDEEEAKRHRRERYLDIYPDNDGMVVIRGRIPREVAAVLEKALDAAMDSIRATESGDVRGGGEEGKETGPDVSAETSPTSVIPAQAGISEDRGLEGSVHVSAETSSTSVIPAEAGISEDRGLERSVHISAETPSTSVIPAQAGISEDRGLERSVHISVETPEQEDFTQRRVDALGLLAEAALGDGLCQSERGEPYQVMIQVDSAVLADQSHEGVCEFESMGGIPAESCRRLACDAPHVTVSQDNDGNLLHIGRKARRASKPLWRALVSRDRECQFPGCNRRRHLQAHHIEHWAKGGETNPDNLILLCRAHHWAVHEGGVRVEGRVRQGLVFHRPDGRVLPTCYVPIEVKGRPGEALMESNRRHGLEITAKTIDGLWTGERMDLHMAVDGVLDCEDDPVDED